MKSEGGTRPARQAPAAFIRHSAFGIRQSAYTLTEVLIVIAIIVLAIGLAVPAIRSLTGNKSQQAAQNVISAFLARTRAEAIGLQRRTGVLFFIDPATDRVNMAEVQTVPPQFYPQQPQGDLQGVTYLDLVADRDFVPLPPGVRLQVLKDNLASAGVIDSRNLFRDARYLGFNNVFQQKTNGASPIPVPNANQPTETMLGGVILFGPSGRIEVVPYGFRFVNHPGGNPFATALGQMAFEQDTSAAGPTAAALTAGNWPTSQTPPSGEVLRTAIGFVLYDRETAQNNGVTDNNSISKQVEDQRSRWLDQNTTPVFINRYNGTLIRAE